MSKYLIYFNQQWVGDHSSEWFQSRGPLARQVVEEMKEELDTMKKNLSENNDKSCYSPKQNKLL